MKNKVAILGILLISVFALSSCANSAEGILVEDVWARPGIQEGNTGVFFMLKNTSSADDKLLSAESNIANAVEIHQTQMEDDVMKMVPQEFVTIPAGEQVVFKPGDFHIMMIGLDQPLQTGDQFMITLLFENAGEQSVVASVREP